MTTLDTQSTAHYGAFRTFPPGTGFQPQIDSLLSAHLGFLALLDGSELPFDEDFCVVGERDDDFEITTAAGETHCIVLAADEPHEITLEHDEPFCVVLALDDETGIV